MERYKLLILFAVIGVVFISGCTQTGQITGSTENKNSEKIEQETTTTAPNIGTEEDAEKAALKFEISMSKADYFDVYELLSPDIQKLFNDSDFYSIMAKNFKDFNFIFKKVVLTDNNEAYAYYEAQGGLIKTTLDPIRMEFVNGEWRFDAFAGILLEIEEKKQNEAKMADYKYFYNIGEWATNGEISVRVDSVKKVTSLTDKYGHQEIPDEGYSFLVVYATLKNLEETPFSLLGFSRFGYFASKFEDEKPFYGGDLCCKKERVSIVEGSLDSMWKNIIQNEEVSGFDVYRVPSQMTKFVVPYDSFYWDYNKQDLRDIYFIVEVN